MVVLKVIIAKKILDELVSKGKKNTKIKRVKKKSKRKRRRSISGGSFLPGY